MATLISHRSSSGNISSCDGRCYNALHSRCSCICGGANHGVGFMQAMDNTRHDASSWIRDYAKAQDVNPSSLGAVIHHDVIDQFSFWLDHKGDISK